MRIIFPTFTVFGHTVGLYGVCIVVGLAIGILVSVAYADTCGIGRDDVFYSMLLGMIGVLIGGKLLYVLINLPTVWRLRDVIFASAESFAKAMGSGYVFYGGLIGAVAFVLWYIKKFRIDASRLLCAAAPSIPLIHSFGRLGCFMAGCCYGKPYDGALSVVFTRSVGAPNGVKLFPSQLMEMAALAFIFLALVLVRIRVSDGWRLVSYYALSYSAVRFLLEFMRGDGERGIYLGLSTSQWISILLFAAGVILLVRRTKTKEAA